MRCLLDKVIARYALQGLLKLAEGQELNDDELLTLDLVERANSQKIDLFIAPQTDNVLGKIAQLPRYAELIRMFRAQVEILFPARYFRRWARRLRDYNFTREDAAMLALATFGTNDKGTLWGMHVVATYDQPMLNHWHLQQASIQARFADMKRDLTLPYNHAVLPDVLRPEQI